MKKTVYVGHVPVGGGAPVSIQSMCNIPFSQFDQLREQALQLQQAGCEILRVSVPDQLSAERFGKLKSCLSIPLLADIHFDYRLALESIRQGADKIRINPGNIGSRHIEQIARCAQDHHIPIRVGVNAGSLEKELLVRYGRPTARALAESAYKNVTLLRQCGFDDIIVSLKASDVPTAVAAYRIYQNEFNTAGDPLHVGITEAGTLRTGLIKSAAGIGALLLDGIGDTIRISLTAPPIEEIYAAKRLLSACGLRKTGVEVISCPTCGRTTVDCVGLANRIEQTFDTVKTPIKIAVMGCVVNGIGEAADADFGVTGANGTYLLFKDRQIVRKNIPEAEIFEVIQQQIEQIEQTKSKG